MGPADPSRPPGHRDGVHPSADTRPGTGDVGDESGKAPPGSRSAEWLQLAAPAALAAGAFAWRKLRRRENPETNLAPTGDPRHDAMLELFRVQTHMNTAMMTAAALRLAPRFGANAAFERYAALARDVLARAVAVNERWPGTCDVQTLVAQPFSQQLAMAADYAEAAGDHARAEAYREESRTLRSQWVEGVARGEGDRSEAMRLAAKGEFNAALVALDELRGAFLADGRVLDAAQTALDLANLYEWLGDDERALEALAAVQGSVAPYLAGGPPTTLQMAGALTRQLEGIRSGERTTVGEDAFKLHRVAVELLTQEGRLRRRAGEWQAAERLLRRAVPFYEPLGVAAGVEFQLAAVALGLGRLDEAEAILTRIAPAFEGSLMRPRKPALLMQRADVLLARQEAGRALAVAEEGIRDLDRYPDLELGWKLRLRRGRALAALGRRRDALEALLEGADDADALRKSPLGYRLDTCYLLDKLPLFETAIDLAVDDEDGASAARLIELVKSRALSAALSLPRTWRDAGDPDAARFDAVSRELDALDYASYAQRMTVAQRREREALLAERTRLLERIRLADPRWRGLSEPVPVDVGALGHLLDRRGAAALTLFHRPGRIVGVLLRGGRAELGVQTLDASVERAIAEYAENLRRWEPDPWLYDLSAERTVGFADLVPAGLVESALDATSLVVVPHGALHLVPWAGLDVDGNRLLERTAVSVLPNLSSLPLLDGAFPDRAGVAVMGDPDYAGLTRYPALEFAGQELEAVAGLYGSRVVAAPLTGPAATEEAFWELARAPELDGGVLHVACHATLEADEPLNSALLLSDSKVDAGELVQTRMTSDEVVLSACSTGWRPERVGSLVLAGDDALGLPAAVLEAGARFVLVSITKAADEPASDLAVGYHRERVAGRAPVAALNAVQRELLAAGEHEPWSWLGTTAYGW